MNKLFDWNVNILEYLSDSLNQEYFNKVQSNEDFSGYTDFLSKTIIAGKMEYRYYNLSTQQDNSCSPILFKEDFDEKFHVKINFRGFGMYWRTLADRIGPIFVRFIFKELYVFYTLPKHNYLQIGGKLNYNTNLLNSYLNTVNKSKIKPIFIKENPKKDNDRMKNKITYQNLFNNSNISEQLSKKHPLVFLKSCNKGAEKLMSEIFGNIFKTSINSKIKRLKKDFIQLIPYFKAMISRFKKINIQKLINHFCPVMKNHNETYSEAIKNYIPISKVSTLIRVLMLKILPKTTYGNVKNKHIILDRITKIIPKHNKDIYILEEFLKNVKLKQMIISIFQLNPRKEFREKEFIKKTVLIKKLWNWIIKNVTFQILKCSFYITTSQSYYNLLFYYRKTQSKFFRRLVIKGLQESHLIKKMNNISDDAFKTIGSIKYILKNTSIRPVFILKKLNSDFEVHLTYNILLSAVKEIPQCKDTSIGSYSELISKLKQFYLKHNNKCIQNQLSPSFNFICADIHNCYHSIDRTKLMGILNDTLPEICYIKKYLCFNMKFQTIRFINIPTFKLIFTNSDKHLSASLSNGRVKTKNCIFIETYCVNRSREEIVSYINDILSKCSFRFDRNSIYTVINGLPQGLRISGLLSTIYLSHMESKHLSLFLKENSNNQNGLLLRWADDYLYINSSIKRMALFINSLKISCNEYGLCLNEKKTRYLGYSSLSTININANNNTQWFTWCGTKINCSNLSTRVSMEKIIGSSYRNSFSISYHKPLSLLMIRLKNLIQTKLPILISSYQLSYESNVSLNIFQVFAVATLKASKYLKEVYSHQIQSRHKAVLLSFLRKIISTISFNKDTTHRETAMIAIIYTMIKCQNTWGRSAIKMAKYFYKINLSNHYIVSYAKNFYMDELQFIL